MYVLFLEITKFITEYLSYLKEIVKMVCCYIVLFVVVMLLTRTGGRAKAAVPEHSLWPIFSLDF